jgi:hypothetical protein
MSESKKRDWRELCEAAATENDLKKRELLLEELLRALDDRQSQSQVAVHQAVATNRSFAIR